MASKQRDRDFKMTVEEAERLTEALKKEKFRKLLAEYASEISDPENKKKYEEEITELEKQRGVDVKFVNPIPGFVMKTVLLPENKKAFVNICQSDTIAKATVSKPAKKRRGEHWNIPFSLSPPRQDLDKAKNKCTVYDAVFNTETYKKGQENPRFKQLLIDTALDAIEKELGDKLDRHNIKFLLMPYKGMSLPTVIKTPGEKTPEKPSSGDLPFTVPYPPLKEELGAKSHKKQEQQKQRSRAPNEPKYSVTHRGEFTIQDFTHARESSRVRRPKELLVTVELPGMESARDMELDIFEKRLLLQCSKPDYRLDLALPYPIDEDKGSAKFDKRRQCLTVTLCVLRQQDPPAPVQPLIAEVHPESANPKPESESHDLADQLTNGDTETLSSEESLDPTVPDISTSNGNTSSDTTDSPPETGVESRGDHMTQPWSAVGAWQCPRFSHRQEEETVSFVLHTPGAKQQTLVQHFDQHQFHLTYRATPASEGVADGRGQGYSLFVRFPESHALSPDDSKVDISEENVVVVLRKAPESVGVWDKFEVGPTAEETAEKLFLTTANVQTVIEEAEANCDPWAHEGTSKDTEVKVVSVSDSQLEVKLCDSQEEPQQTPATTEVKPQEPQLQKPPDPQNPQEECQQEPPATQDIAENTHEPREDPTDALSPQESAQEHNILDSQEPQDEPQPPKQETPTTQDIDQEPPQSQEQQSPEDTAAAVKQACQEEATGVETSDSGVQVAAEMTASGRECPTPENRDTDVVASSQDSPSSEDGGTKEEDELSPVTDSTEGNSSSVTELQCSTEADQPTASQVEAETPPKSSCDEEETAVCSETSAAVSPPPPGRVVVQEDGSVVVRITRTGAGLGGAEKQIQFSNKFMFDLD